MIAIDGLIGKLDPSFIDKPDISNPDIFNMDKPTISIDRTVNTTFTGSVNVLD